MKTYLVLRLSRKGPYTRPTWTQFKILLEAQDFQKQILREGHYAKIDIYSEPKAKKVKK